MRHELDLTEKQFGKLTAIKRVGKDKYNNVLWLCKCECGNEKIAKCSLLRRGSVQSCGCWSVECRKTHGLSHTRLDNIYCNMKSRCYNISNPKYRIYGGRGISICDEWNNKENGRSNFFKWALSNGYKENLSIDRINNDGNYEPNNCRWTDNKTQCNNRRNRIANTGFVGITYNKRIKKYQASYCVNRKTIYVGVYDTIDDAKEARERAMNKREVTTFEL